MKKDISLGVPRDHYFFPIYKLFINDYSKYLKHPSVTMQAKDISQNVGDKSVDAIEKNS